MTKKDIQEMKEVLASIRICLESARSRLADNQPVPAYVTLGHAQRHTDIFKTLLEKK